MDQPLNYKELLARQTVNLRNQREIDLWTEALDIYTADLVLAVAQVGESTADVFEYMQSNGIPGSRGRTPEPTPKHPSASDS